MGEFESSGWALEAASRDYRERADIYIQDRRVLLATAAGFLRRFVSGPPGRRVLDLGCGDGALGETLKAADPSISLTLVDGSADMLEAARRRLSRWPDPRFRRMTFDEMLRGDPPWTSLDLVASSFAIHHLPTGGKEPFFRRIGEMLAPGGRFLNLDILRPVAAAHEAWYDEIWREWIVAAQRLHAPGEDLSSTPEDARRKPENRYETLEDQLEWLRQSGFVEVECHYRSGLFGAYSGRRPPD